MRILSKIRNCADKIEDILGAIAIFALMVAGFWLAYGFGTDADQLVGLV